MAERWSNLIDEFVNVTGADTDRAKSLLNATNGNLQMAIEMHFDSGGNDDGGETRSTSRPDVSEPSVESSSSSNIPHSSSKSDGDDVRAPIPQTRGILVDEPYTTFGNRKRTSKSVFDAFRDFQAEARQQELEATGAISNKHRTLQDLFRPPIDLLHKGTFETAKVSGQQQSKWLLVNVQDVKEFQCQQLNRDVWSNDQVRTMIKANFVLWQVYRDTDEGERFIQFYHVTSFPHIAVVDPRTGEKLVDWGYMDAQAFNDCASEFLLGHPGLGEESPPQKKMKKNSIVDASEQSQLEAAIAESLRYSTSSVNDNEEESQNDEDDDLQFTDSESDGETWVPQKISKGKTTTTNTENNTKNTEEKQATSSNNTTDINSTSKDSLVNHKDNKTSDSIQNNIHTSLPCSSNENANKKSNENSSSLSTSSTSKKGSVNVDCYQEWIIKQGPSCKIMLRFPNGGRKQVSIHADAPMLALVQYVQSEGFTNERYELVTNFPRKQLSYLDFSVTLKDAGLFPHETVFVQER